MPVNGTLHVRERILSECRKRERRRERSPPAEELADDLLNPASPRDVHEPQVLGAVTRTGSAWSGRVSRSRSRAPCSSRPPSWPRAHRPRGRRGNGRRRGRRRDSASRAGRSRDGAGAAGGCSRPRHPRIRPRPRPRRHRGGGPARAARVAAQDPVVLNTATHDELRSIAGIGEVRWRSRAPRASREIPRARGPPQGQGHRLRDAASPPPPRAPRRSAEPRRRRPTRSNAWSRTHDQNRAIPPPSRPLAPWTSAPRGEVRQKDREN